MTGGIFCHQQQIIALLGSHQVYDGEWHFGVMMMDVVATTLVADPSTSLTSGFTALYLVTVAAASMLLTSRQLATLVAAHGTRNVSRHSSLCREGSETGGLLYAGLRGLLVFLVSWLGQLASATLVQAESVQKSPQKARRLKLFNDQIVEHMQTGILLVA